MIMRQITLFFSTIALIVLITVNLVYAEMLFVSIRSLPIKCKERIVGFKLSARPARIITLSSIPGGWNITVDNDPSMNATVYGSLIVGAAALSSEFFTDFITIDRDEALDLKFDAKAEVVVTEDFKNERQIHLDFKDFIFRKTKRK
jgi:hypothetical protein